MSDNKEKNSVESKHLSVYKSDIKNIGGTMCENFDDEDISPGGTSFFCDVNLANIEEILLREILDLYGYKIMESMDHGSLDDIENMQIRYVTNMPWEEYMALKF